MQNLLALLTRYFHWLLFLLLEVASVVLLFRYNSYQGSVWVSSANSVAGKLYEWQSGVEQFFHLQERAHQLAQRNLELEYQLSHARQSLLDLGRDTAVVDSALHAVVSGLQLLPAKVISSTLRRRDKAGADTSGVVLRMVAQGVALVVFVALASLMLAGLVG